MSTASVPTGSTANQPHPSDGLIAERIEAVRSALWRSELTRSLLLLVLFIIAILLGWAIIDQWIWSGGPMLRLAAWAATAGLIIVWSMRRIVPLFTSQIDAAYAAHSIERDIPDIKHALSSYVALRDQRDVSGLRGVVVRSIGSRAAGRLKQHEGQLPSEIASSFQLWIMVAVAFAVLAAYTVFSPKDTIHSAGRLILPLSPIDPPTRVRILEVNPGHTEILAGQEVEVVARIAGLRDSDEPRILWEFGSEQRKIPLRIDDQRGLPFFHASLGGVYGIESSGHYTVQAGDASSERFEITTSDVPVAYVESVHYQPPAYTKLPERTTRAAAIEGVEGTTVTLVASTNRPITDAQVELNPRTTGGRTTATAGVFPMQIDSEGTKITAKIVLRTGADQPGVVPLSSYRIRIADSDGAKNPEPVVHPIRVLPDLAPEVTIASPVRNPKDVPVDAQQLIEVHALDPDFGLTRIALRMARGPQRLDDVVLWQDVDSEPRNQIALYRFRPRDLGLHPGDVVRVRAVATDNRMHPRKQSFAPNVTVSDPVELRIVEAANMNESRPSEDGLSAPDDQPAVDPPKDGESGTEDQQQENGDSSSAGSSGQSGSAEESSSEGDSSDDGSPSEGPAEGEQEGASSSEQNGQGKEEAADDSNSGGGSSQSPTSDANGEDGSAADDANGADSASPPSSSQTENGAEQDPSTSPEPGESSPAPGESPAGEDAQASDAEASSGQESADSSPAANGDASTEPEESPEGMNGEQNGTPEPSDGAGATEGAESTDGAEANDGTAATDGRDQSSSPQSPPKHDGEAIERIKEYLDEQQEGRRQPSPADRSPDQRDAEADADAGAAEQEPSTDDRPPNGGETDPSLGDPGMDGDSAADDASSSDAEPSDRSGQSDDPTDRADDADDPSPGDSSGDETSSDGDSADDASETDQADETPKGDPAGEESESDRDPSAPPSDSSDDAGTDTEDASSQQDASPSSEDPAASDSQDPDPSASPAEQPSSEDQPTTAEGAEQNVDSPPDSTESSATTGRNGSTDLDETTSDFIESDEAPEPVDLEYAKKATDMVLDYLKETRDRPDQELLDRLNWSEEDMDRFLNRWESARQMQRGNGGDGSEEFEEALRSLGIRDRSTAGRGAEAEQADRLRDLRDSGTRRPAPTLYRDAFEAFRRSVAR